MRSAKQAMAIVLVSAALTTVEDRSAQAAPASRAIAIAPIELPRRLDLDTAVRLFRERGLDLWLAQVTAMTALGNVETVRAFRNPSASVGAGPVYNYSTDPTPDGPCSGCAKYALSWTLADNGVALDFLSGKRGLRIEAARAAFEAAKLGRADAERNIVSQIKQQYVQAALQRRVLDFTTEVVRSMTQTFELTRFRYPGLIDEGALARVEIQKLEAEQAAAQAAQAFRQAEVGLAFLIGVRSEVPEFEVDPSVLEFLVPQHLAQATQEALLDRALAARSDLAAFLRQRERAQAGLDLARRLRIPDVSLSLAYSSIGFGPKAAAPPTLTANVTSSLPIFYQQQGEIRRAEADVVTQQLSYAKTEAQIASDIGIAFAQVIATRELVERMQGRLLERAKTARDILERQFKAGAAKLIDFLDAERTYIAINIEYLQDQAAYWTAVYQLERATGIEFPR